MTLRVLRYIEDHRQKRQTTDITTIERALMMIGIEIPAEPDDGVDEAQPQ